MIWVIIIIAAILLIGPLRRPFLNNWRTIVPLIFGMIVGGILACMFINVGWPGWYIFFGPVAGALSIGSAGKKWLDENF